MMALVEAESGIAHGILRISFWSVHRKFITGAAHLQVSVYDRQTDRLTFFEVRETGAGQWRLVILQEEEDIF